MLDPWEVATFRFEQIAPLLDEKLSRAEKGRALREKTRSSVEWPQSEEDRRAGKPPLKKPIGRSTLLRWRELYQKKGILGLFPVRPKHRNQERAARAEVTAYALGLLWENPDRSFHQLLTYLEIEFPDRTMTRSTLHRDLNAHPAYEGILKRREGKGGGRRLRDLYETSRPHECWQLDGKGPFSVHLHSGKGIRVHVLSVIDDFSRFILATIIAMAEDIAAAVRVFRLAVSKYGLADRMQFDHGSAFDSKVFREGLALCGVHRNWVKARNPEAQGDIEAFHKILKRWFISELRHQEIANLGHLEELLQATIDFLYNQRHRHRVLKMTPAEALAGTLVSRRVSHHDLLRAFWETTNTISHAKTGEVILPNGHFRVPVRHAGKKRTFRCDPVESDQAVLILPTGEELPLKPFRKKPAFQNERPRGTGQLQKIADRWHGQERPNAQPGFGLPEVFRELSRLTGYVVPKEEREAATIQAFYKKFGPLPQEPFRNAIQKTARALGSGRALKTYLDHLERLIRRDQKPSKEKEEEE